MTPGLGWFAYCLRHYTRFGGRAARAEYWSFWAVTLAFYWALRAPVTPLFDVLGWGWSAGITVPHLAVTSRRLHDSGHSFWWAGSFYIGSALLAVFGLAVRGRPPISHYQPLPALLFLAYMIAWFGITLRMFYLLLKRSDVGPNKYGPPAPATPN